MSGAHPLNWRTEKLRLGAAKQRRALGKNRALGWGSSAKAEVSSPFASVISRDTEASPYLRDKPKACGGFKILLLWLPKADRLGDAIQGRSISTGIVHTAPPQITAQPPHGIQGIQGDNSQTENT